MLAAARGRLLRTSFDKSCRNFCGLRAKMSSRSTAGIIIIGDEILKGQTQDTNTHFLAENLHKKGIQLKRVVVIPDDVDEIANEVRHFSESFTYVITSGGVGPTHDDVTFEGVARAFGDDTFIHPEIREVLKTHFKDLNEAVLKLARVPRSATLNYTSVTLPAGQSKYPLVSVRNVYIFPGIPELLRKAFVHLNDDLFRSDYKAFVRECFVADDEFRIAETVNKFVDKYRDATFGSYPQWTNNYVKTKVTVEADNEEMVDKVAGELESELSTIDFDKSPEVDTRSKIDKLAADTKDPDFKVKLQEAQGCLVKCYADYDPDQVSVTLNGGKDCIATLHLVHGHLQAVRPGARLAALYIRCPDSFPEIEDYVRNCAKMYNLDLETIDGPMKPALAAFLASRPKIKAMVLGTRKSDPKSNGQGHFAPTDNDWPELMRVNPVINWRYQDVWLLIRDLFVPYPALYDRGYTSLGSVSNTKPNPHLAYADPGGKTKYRPAYQLEDGSLERAGRVKDDE